MFNILAGMRDLPALLAMERNALLRDSFENTSVLVYVTGIVAAGICQRGRSNDWRKIKDAAYGGAA